MRLIDFFIDPLYQVSMIGSLLMCFCTSVLGVIVYLKKRSLIGEVLSHAAYPGVAIAVAFFYSFLDESSFYSYLTILMGAFTCCATASIMIRFLEKEGRLFSDTALCFTLSAFLGLGVLITSFLQITHPVWVSRIQLFLYGQVATMTMMHLIIYVIFTLLLLLVVLSFTYPWKIILFDELFAKAIHMRVRVHEKIMNVLIILAIVIGIRVAGVVLISGMLIAPALAARQFTSRLHYMFFWAGLVGVISGILGNYYSIVLPILFNTSITMPTGPMIIVFSSLICFMSILFAPRQGRVLRFLKKIYFHYQCVYENLLKFFWKKEDHIVAIEEIQQWSLHPYIINILLVHLRMNQLIQKKDKQRYSLTERGICQAQKIIRLHRLWEVYLFKYLGYCEKKVHTSAEEMEHIITPELEKQLTELLKDPKQDPHNQPIPKNKGCV
ncbi:MAG: metal ABC transporter permease [Chlamydiales bacterium]|nr:metal ABC transporter permease [Chlamydiales bacterium]